MKLVTRVSVVSLVMILTSSTHAPAQDTAPRTVEVAATVDEILAARDYDPERDADTLRLYRAFLGREPDPAGARYWIDQTRGGATLDDLAFGFANSIEFRTTYGDVSDAEFLDLIYRNMLNRIADPAGRSYWLDQMSGGLAPHLVVRWVVANDEFVGKHPFSPRFAPCDRAAINDSWRLHFDDEVDAADRTAVASDVECRDGIAVGTAHYTALERIGNDAGIAVLVSGGEEWAPVTRLSNLVQPYCNPMVGELLGSTRLPDVKVSAAVGLLGLDACQPPSGSDIRRLQRFADDADFDGLVSWLQTLPDLQAHCCDTSITPAEAWEPGIEAEFASALTTVPVRSVGGAWIWLTSDVRVAVTAEGRLIDAYRKAQPS